MWPFSACAFTLFTVSMCGQIIYILSGEKICHSHITLIITALFITYSKYLPWTQYNKRPSLVETRLRGGTRDKTVIDWFNKDQKSVQPFDNPPPIFPQGPKQTLLACNELRGAVGSCNHNNKNDNISKGPLQLHSDRAIQEHCRGKQKLP